MCSRAQVSIVVRADCVPWRCPATRGRWRFCAQRPFPSMITAMCRGKDGGLLLVGLFHGLLRQRNGRFETLVPVTSLPSSSVISMAESADGKVQKMILETKSANLTFKKK